MLFFLLFRNLFLKVRRPVQNPIYNIHDPMGIKYLTRLILGLSQLNDHKFRHNFHDCLNQLCPCSHYFLRCQYYNDIRNILLDTVK